MARRRLSGSGSDATDYPKRHFSIHTNERIIVQTALFIIRSVGVQRVNGSEAPDYPKRYTGPIIQIPDQPPDSLQSDNVKRVSGTAGSDFRDKRAFREFSDWEGDLFVYKLMVVSHRTGSLDLT